MGFGAFGVGGYRATEGLGGLIRLIEAHIAAAQSIPGHRIFRVGFSGFLEIGQRLFVFALDAETGTFATHRRCEHRPLGRIANGPLCQRRRLRLIGQQQQRLNGNGKVEVLALGQLERDDTDRLTLVI